MTSSPREAVIDKLSDFASEPSSFSEEGARRWAESVLDDLLAVRVPCSTCHGTGWVRHEEGSYMGGSPMSVGCRVCSGSGYVGALTMNGDE